MSLREQAFFMSGPFEIKLNQQPFGTVWDGGGACPFIIKK